MLSTFIPKWLIEGGGQDAPRVRDPGRAEIVGIPHVRPASWRDLFNSAGHSSVGEHLLGRCQTEGESTCGRVTPHNLSASMLFF